MVNYLSNACIEVVQTFLLLSNTLSNGMNAGASWVLLGKLVITAFRILLLTIWPPSELQA